jgi:hypothetical protein
VPLRAKTYPGVGPALGGSVHPDHPPSNTEREAARSSRARVGNIRICRRPGVLNATDGGEGQTAPAPAWDLWCVRSVLSGVFVGVLVFLALLVAFATSTGLVELFLWLLIAAVTGVVVTKLLRLGTGAES